MAYTPFGHSMRTSPAELRRHRQREEARRAILDATEAPLLAAGSGGFAMRRPPLPRVRRLRDAQSHVLPAPRHAPARGPHAPPLPRGGARGVRGADPPA